MKARVQSILAASVVTTAAAMASAPVALADGYAGRAVYAQPYNWSGFYFGTHDGVVWNNISSCLTPTTPAVGCVFPSNDHADVTAGGHFGIQHQWGAWVLGVEAGFDAIIASHHGNAQVIPNTGNLLSYDARVENTLYVGPRLGYAAGKWLPYVSGGFASGRVDTEISAAPVATPGIPLGAIIERSTDRQNGWFVATGLEWALTPNAIVGVEYKHYDLGSEVQHGFLTGIGGSTPGTPSGINRNVSVTEDLVTARLSFKFGAREPAPLK